MNSMNIRYLCLCALGIVMPLWAVSSEAVRIAITPDSRTHATIECIEGESRYIKSMTSLFSHSSTTGNINQVTKNNRLTLTLTGFPDCTLTNICVEGHSNKQAGAGRLTITRNGTTIMTLGPGRFPSWQAEGYWSTEPVSFSQDRQDILGNADTLCLTLSATENSLYLDHLLLTLVPTPATTHTVILHSWDSTYMEQLDTIQETSIGAGVLLPSMPLVLPDSLVNNWTQIGWTEEEYLDRIDEPAYHSNDHRFFPTRDMDLYALYTNSIATVIEQDTLYASGIYAIVKRYPDGNAYMAIGGTSTGSTYLTTRTCALSQTDGLYRLTLSHLDNDARYYMDRTGDSVYLMHVGTQTYIGYSDKSTTSRVPLVNRDTPWALRTGLNHSVILSHASKKAGLEYTLHTMIIDVPGEDYEYTYFYAFVDQQVSISSNYEAVLLFPIPASFPTTAPEAHWTCRPLIYDAIEDIVPEKHAKARIEIVKGQVVILTPSGQRYTLMGQRMD